jgi:hypothetical protein
VPKKTLPKGWPTPHALLRNPNWEETYPKIVLRGIHDIMEKVPGDVETRFIAGFNIIVHKLTLVAHPPRLHLHYIKKGILNMEALTSKGKEREAEVTGLRNLSPASRRRYGNKRRAEMKNDTLKKLRKLRPLIAMAIATTAEEGMTPPGSPTQRGGSP